MSGNHENEPLSYREAGVDIDAAERALAAARREIETTLDDRCLSRAGSFGGLYRVPVEDYREPVLVSSTDSVGTKVKVAVRAGRHDTVGRDIVNHCVNDILVQGARPLFFLDYIGIGRVEPGVISGLLAGLARACRENGCALIGGETAELRDVYAEGEYDLVGTVVGVVERDRILDGSRVRPGDAILGLPSTGLHTNGYTLARRIFFERAGLAPESRVPELGVTAAEALLAVHRSYLGAVFPLLEGEAVSALAHITGGGIPDNVPRVLPPGCRARIHRGSWEVPPLFRFLAERGPVAESECFRVFNMGIGFVLVVRPEHEEEVRRRLAESGEEPVRIGEVEAGERGVEFVG